MGRKGKALVGESWDLGVCIGVAVLKILFWIVDTRFLDITVRRRLFA